jgi:hypothetical protein
MEEEDNKIVTLADLEENDETEKVVTQWDSKDKIKYASENMEKLKNIKFENYPQNVLDLAMFEILDGIGWTDYVTYKNNVENIINGIKYPFCLRTKDKLSRKLDFWLVRTFINFSKFPTYNIEDKVYKKKEVLVSKQFNNCLRKYCKEQLKDEVQFWFFTGTLNGEQKLDMSRFSSTDMILLSSRGDGNPDDLIMFQFKKKTREIMVGTN